MFSNYDAYKEALYDLLDDGKIYKASSVDREKMKYYRVDKMFALDVIY